MHMTLTIIRDRQNIRANGSCRSCSAEVVVVVIERPWATHVRSGAIAQYLYATAAARAKRQACHRRSLVGFRLSDTASNPRCLRVFPPALIHPLSSHSPERHCAAPNIAPSSQTRCV